MFNSPFDGNAAFSGGGFMPSQATQSADPSFSSAKSRETQHLLPLTVKQINQAFLSTDEKSNILIDGVDVNSVKLVGMVVNKAEKVTDVSFLIDDGTGRMDCIRWVHEAADMKEMEGITEGMYVRVHGHLKGFQGKKQLAIFSVRPVIDFNEITYHFVECTYVHNYNTRLRNLQGSAPTAGHIPYAAASTPLKGYQAAPSNQFSGVQYSTDGLNGIDKIVLNYMQQPSCLAPEMGVHRDQIARDLKLPMEKLMDSITALEAEGLIYSSVDEFHFRSTHNG